MDYLVVCKPGYNWQLKQSGQPGQKHVYDVINCRQVTRIWKRFDHVKVIFNVIIRNHFCLGKNTKRYGMVRWKIFIARWDIFHSASVVRRTQMSAPYHHNNWTWTTNPAWSHLNKQQERWEVWPSNKNKETETERENERGGQKSVW